MIPRTWSLLTATGRILLEFTPKGVDLQEIGTTVAAQTDVTEVHDLHAWEISSGFPALYAHVLVKVDRDCHSCRRDLEKLLKDRFAIKHTPLQVDHDRRETHAMVKDFTGESR
jgi:cobalt-zinc-cadmium efflux system protein